MRQQRHANPVVESGQRRNCTASWRAAAPLAAAVLMSLVPVPVRGELAACQAGLQAAAKPLVAKSLPAIQKCLNKYRQAPQDPVSVGSVAAGCERAFEKAIRFPDASGKSIAAKTKAKLEKLYTSGRCSDGELLALGHLPPASFGSLWADVIVVTTLRSMLATCQSMNGTCKPILEALYQTGQCPICGDLDPMAYCNLAASSSACFDSDPLADVSLTLAGTVGFFVTPFSGYLIASQGPQAYQFNYGGGTTLCLRTLGLLGVINGPTSSIPTVSYATCQDHWTAPAESEECTGVCLPETADLVHGGLTNGGQCFAFSLTTPTVGGGVFVTWVSEKFVSPAEVGIDGLPCTPDDAVAAAPPMLAILTTAEASASTRDTDASNGVVLPNGPTCPTGAAGAAFNFSAVASVGDLGGGRLVSTIPLLHGPIGDQVQTFGLDCQP